MRINAADIPRLLLTHAVRRMPAERSEWGAAMLAELAQLQHPSTRWGFALGCARVALFPPRKGGLQQSLMINTIKNIATRPRVAALIGFLFIVPFILLNMIIANRIEPFFSLIRPGIHNSPLDYILLSITLFLLPVGAFIAIRPMFRKGADGKRKLYLANSILATLLLIVFVLLSVGLWSDIYRCDILQIPNCD